MGLLHDIDTAWTIQKTDRLPQHRAMLENRLSNNPGAQYWAKFTKYYAIHDRMELLNRLVSFLFSLRCLSVYACGADAIDGSRRTTFTGPSSLFLTPC